MILTGGWYSSNRYFVRSRDDSRGVPVSRGVLAMLYITSSNIMLLLMLTLTVYFFSIVAGGGGNGISLGGRGRRFWVD